MTCTTNTILRKKPAFLPSTESGILAVIIDDQVKTTSKPTAGHEAMLDQTQETSCWKTPQLITCTEPSSLSANPASFPQHARSVVRTKKKRSVRGSRKDVGEWRPNRSQRLSREVEESEPLLACPFVKHNPLASPGCWEFAAENLARLK
jgi:hypothetical protein